MRIIVSSVSCNHCGEQREFENEQEELEAGWLIVQQQNFSDEIEMLDFCDAECLRTHFG